MSKRTVWALQLSFCCLIILPGCSFPKSLGFAKKKGPDTDTEVAAARTTVSRGGRSDTALDLPHRDLTRSDPASARPDSVEEEGDSGDAKRTFVSRAFQKTKSWSPFGKSKKPARSELGATNDLYQPPERELSKVTPALPSTSESPNYYSAYGAKEAYRAKRASREERKLSPGSSYVAPKKPPTTTPSLVRRSRRPPPDPAPKPPQERLIAKNPRPGSTIDDTIRSASRAWQGGPSGQTAVASNRSSTKPSPTSELKFSPPKRQRHDTEPARVAKRGQLDPGRSSLLAARDELMQKKAAEQAESGTSNWKPVASQSRTRRLPTVVSSSKWVAKKTSPASSAKARPMRGALPDTKRTQTPTKLAKTNVNPETVVADTFAVAHSKSDSPAPGAMAKSAEKPGRVTPQRPKFAPAAPAIVTNEFAAGKKYAATMPSTAARAKPRPPSGLQRRAQMPLKAASIAANRSTKTPARSTASATQGSLIRRPSASRQSRLGAGNTWNPQPAYEYPWNPLVASRARPKADGARTAEPISLSPVAAMSPAHSRPPNSRGPVVVPPRSPRNVLAPVVDAKTYRAQLARSHRARPHVTTVSARQQPAARGTWLATYQKLMRDATKQPPPHAPRDAETRSLSSGAAD